VGLVQREIDAAGFSTISLSMIPELTASEGAPRIAAIEDPFGVTLGRPGDAAGQLAVLRAALGAIAEPKRASGGAAGHAVPGAAFLGTAAVHQSDAARERRLTATAFIPRPRKTGTGAPG
jgi:hypothetical protein